MATFKDRGILKFPSRVLAATGVAVEKLAGVYTFTLDFLGFSTTSAIADASLSQIIVFTDNGDETANYNRITVHDFAGASAANIFALITGDVTINSSGVSAIGTTKVTSTMLNADVFSSAHSWAGQQTFVAPILGTPASATLTNATGLPISTGISGLGTGVADFLAAPTSANLASAVTNETGSGALVFATSPSLTTPTIGAATGTSLALNGATLGSNTLAVSGSVGASGTYRAQNAAAIPAGGTAGTGYLFSSTSNYGVSFGSGAPTLAMAQGSLYLRSDGAPYYNTDGSTGWTSLATPAIANVTGLGTGVATALGTSVGSAGAFVTFNGALGTPSSGTLTNATGLPVSSGVSGLGTGVATFLATPSSANLRAALTDETGTGIAYFVGGALGTPSSATLTSATGLPISTGVSGLGTGIATALAVNTGSAGAPVLFNGALGTPSSGTLTSATGLPISTGVSGLGTGVATALGVNVGSAGAPVVNGGALGTPSSGTLTSATGLPLTTGVTGTLPVANGGTNITAATDTAATIVARTLSVGISGSTNNSSSGSGAYIAQTPTVSVPANYITTNRMLKVKLFFLFNTGAAAPTFSFKLRLGGTDLLEITANTPANNLTNRLYMTEIDLIGMAAPSASSNVMAALLAGTNSFANQILFNNIAQPVAVATNGSLTLDILTQWGSAGTGTNTAQLYGLTVEAAN